MFLCREALDRNFGTCQQVAWTDHADKTTLKEALEFYLRASQFDVPQVEINGPLT